MHGQIPMIFKLTRTDFQTDQVSRSVMMVSQSVRLSVSLLVDQSVCWLVSLLVSWSVGWAVKLFTQIGRSVGQVVWKCALQPPICFMSYIFIIWGQAYPLKIMNHCWLNMGGQPIWSGCPNRKKWFYKLWAETRMWIGGHIVDPSFIHLTITNKLNKLTSSKLR